MKCPDCRGEGWTKTDPDEPDIGTFLTGPMLAEETETCERCEGEGSIPCPACFDSLIVDCEPDEPSFYDSDWIRSDCETCEGNG